MHNGLTEMGTKAHQINITNRKYNIKNKKLENQHSPLVGRVHSSEGIQKDPSKQYGHREHPRSRKEAWPSMHCTRKQLGHPVLEFYYYKETP